MALPVPNLDDRTFQDIVREARSQIPRHCPEWTDHNLSDPGITLIELFAWMTETMLYRLNKVPEKNYITFLDMIGVKLAPASPAITDITLKLSAPQPAPVTIPAGTEVGTVRTETQESIIFTTDADLTIQVPILDYFLLTRDNENFVDFTTDLTKGKYTDLFRDIPQENNAFYLGFEQSIGRHTLVINMECEHSKGVGINPADPPILWEYWDRSTLDWQAFERRPEAVAWLEADNTGAFNRTGTIVLHIPDSFAPTTVSLRRAHWIRCRVVEPRPDQPAYIASPAVSSISVASMGGTVSASHGVRVVNEQLGYSTDNPGQTFRLRNRPILALAQGETILVQTQGSEYEDWTEVEDFSQSTYQDKHFVCDTSTGEIKFGPSIRQPNGETIQYGAIPPKDKLIKLSAYRYGGGSIGNVGKNTLTALKSSIPYVAAVTNRRAATGGTDPETVENAQLRGPQVFRTRNRAITESDFEFLALEASPGVARAKCVQPREITDNDGPPPGVVMVLLIPVVSSTEGHIPPSELELTRGVKEEVQAYLDDRRLLSTMLVIGQPSYHWVSVEARVKTKSGFDPIAVQRSIEQELFRFINPLTGGPDGHGWPFGRDLIISEVYSCIQQRVPGVEYVEEARIYPVDMATKEKGEATQRLVIARTGVMCCHEHVITMF